MSNGFDVSYTAGGELDKVKTVGVVTKVNGLASKTRPYNTMQMFSIPAIKDNFEFNIALPKEALELAGLSLTCSGYGEEDCYDVYVNDMLWFDNWYTSEVKESLLAGTSTYVYEVPENSTIKLVFKNRSGTAKKVWLGVRMLID